MALGGFGLGLANLGGIAGGLQQYNLRDAQYRQALAQLAMEQRRQQLMQQQQQAMGGFFAAAKDPSLAGLLSTPQAGPPGAVSAPDYSPGSIQMAALPPPLPQVPSYRPNPMGTAGLGGPRMTGQGGLIEQTESGGRNVRNYRFDPTHTASGVAQITDSTWNRYAPQVGAPQLSYPASPMNRPVAEQRKVEQAIYDKEGPAPWAKFNPTLAAQIENLDGAQQREASAGAVRTATSIPPQMAGRIGLPQLAQIVDRTSPGASDEVKGAILTQLYDVLAKPAQQQFQQQWEQFKFLQEEQDKARSATETHARDVETERYHRAREAQAGGAGGQKYEQTKQLEITMPDGSTQTVMARESKSGPGWVYSIGAQEGQPVQIPAGATVKEVTAGTAGGGRAGAQVQRQLTGGAEVKADLQNVANMPVGTTTGYLGGLVGERSGISLMNAAKIDLANTITDTDAVNMKIALAGLGRELSTLMSPVYGGNWASEQLEPMIPKAGYSIENSLYGIARIKQSAHNALESLQASPVLGPEQKKYAAQLIKEVDEAIPWTVQDVVAFRQQQNPQETFGKFAGRSGVAGAASRPATAAQKYEIGQIVTGKDGKQYRVTGGDLSGDPDVEPAASAPIPQ